jgi:hypothetical protein
MTRTSQPTAAVLWAAALGAASCSTGGTSAKPSPGDPGACRSNSQVFITDDTNYTFALSPSIRSIPVKDATDIQFDWSNLTQDFFGRPLDPQRDINLVLVSLWNMTEAQMTASIGRDKLPLTNNLGVLTSYPDGAVTSVDLLGLTSFGVPVPPDQIWSRFDTSTPSYEYASNTHTFMLTAASGTMAGKNTQMLTYFRLDPSSANTRVALTNDSALMAYSVSLQSARPVLVPPSKADLNIDWSKMTINALGDEYVGSQITRAMVAHFSGLSLRDLEEQFLNLESLADGWWQADVPSDTNINLSTAVNEGGSPFAGIDNTGVWLVGLMCDVGCNSPAPWSITILAPCA